MCPGQREVSGERGETGAVGQKSAAKRKRTNRNFSPQMYPAQQTVDSAIQELDKLRKLLLRNQSVQQVRSIEETSIIGATAHAWFNSHRPVLAPICGDANLADIDQGYN